MSQLDNIKIILCDLRFVKAFFEKILIFSKIALKDLIFYLGCDILKLVLKHNMPVWWNWQTRWTQNPVVVIPYRFDPDHRHQRRERRTFTKILQARSSFFNAFLGAFPTKRALLAFRGSPVNWRSFSKTLQARSSFFIAFLGASSLISEI